MAPGLWLVVADVPHAEFGTDALTRRFKDPEWVSTCGLAHQAAIEACLRATAVVPMALFTIFDTDARALDEARRNAARLDASLDRVAGRAEWVVRVLRAERTELAPARAGSRALTASAASAFASVADAPAGTRAAALSQGTPARRRAADVPAPAPSSGRAFLQAKAEQRQAVRRAADETDAAVRALASALAGVSDDVQYREAVQGIGTGAVLDAAFLVPHPSAARFRREARRLARPLAERGFRVSVTGPWPGYSFVAARGTS